MCKARGIFISRCAYSIHGSRHWWRFTNLLMDTVFIICNIVIFFAPSIIMCVTMFFGPWALHQQSTHLQYQQYFSVALVPDYDNQWVQDKFSTKNNTTAAISVSKKKHASDVSWCSREEIRMTSRWWLHHVVPSRNLQRF
jgi:hypothetical protein